MSESQQTENAFRHILVAAKRAEQLIAGARPRVDPKHLKLVKPTTIALAELQADLVPWRIVSAEEYEILLQEEIAAREREEHAPAILTAPRPPVPVVEEPELEEEEELDEFEDELEGPDFEEELEEVTDAVPDELIVPEV